MALSDRERRLLAEMEAALASDDPRLQSTLAGGDTQTLIRKAPGSLIGGIALILAGIGILFTGLISQITPVGVAGFIVALIGLLMSIRSAGSISITGPRVKSPKRSLNDRLQERWDRRSFEQ
ncbi:MAG: hypothetical protein RL428_995 [Actinomycetota bacterium]|jgi:hypothetical protein